MPTSGMPAWKIAVYTVTAPELDSNLRNALLYGDHVHWVSLEPVFGFISYIQALQLEAEQTGTRLALPEDMDGFIAKYLRTVPEYEAFREELAKSGATRFITDHFSVDDFRRDMSLWQKSTPEHLIRSRLDAVAADSRVVAYPGASSGRRGEHWNAYQATHVIATSISQRLLPDVSDLPLDVILEMRERLSPILGPMRAELLRFTEILRVMVGESDDPTKLAAEADNLVATKVEPVVREADEQARRLLDAKWRKLLTGAAKAFGFAGAGFVDPKMWAKAVQQTFETGALALAEPEDKTPQAKATSQFVLQAHSFLADRTS